MIPASRASSHVLYTTADGVYARAVEEKKARRLADRTVAHLRPTPNGEHVVISGFPFARHPIEGKGAPVTVAPKEVAASSPSLAVSNRHAAFVNAAGTVVLAKLSGGPSTIVDLAPPNDKRCHRGAGVPRTFSPDGNYLSVQHGCDFEYLVETALGSLRQLPFVSALFVQDQVVGSPKRDGHTTSEVVVLDPKTHESWTMEGVAYSPFRLAVPGRLAFVQVNGARLELVDLAAKKVVNLDEGTGRVTGFLSTSADGRWAYYSALGENHCSLHAVDLASGQQRLLARVDAGQQCFVRPLEGTRVAGYAWRSQPTEAILLVADVETGTVTQLGPPVAEIGSLHTAGDTILLSGRTGTQVGVPR